MPDPGRGARLEACPAVGRDPGRRGARSERGRDMNASRMSASAFGLVSILAAIALGARSADAAQSRIIGWGEQVFDSSWNEEPFVEIAASHLLTLARRRDGSVVAWGFNGDGGCQVPV